MGLLRCWDILSRTLIVSTVFGVLKSAGKLPSSHMCGKIFAYLADGPTWTLMRLAATFALKSKYVSTALKNNRVCKHLLITCAKLLNLASAPCKAPAYVASCSYSAIPGYGDLGLMTAPYLEPPPAK